MKDYIIKQYPANKEIEQNLLSIDQRLLRAKSHRVYEYGPEKKCNTCGCVLPINEFWLKDSKTGRRNNRCRDCELKLDGCIEIGKQRFAFKIFDKGFRRCSICKEIKPLNDYPKNKQEYGGYANTCKVCNKKLHDEYWENQRNELGESYVKQMGKLKGITEFTNEVIDDLRKEIQESRKPVIYLDGREFYTIREFAIYIKDTYNNPITQTEKRLSLGKTPKDCILSEHDFRSIAYTKNRICFTDLVTGQKYVFKNSKDPDLIKIFGKCSIARIIKNGGIVKRITKAAVYKNPYRVDIEPLPLPSSKDSGEVSAICSPHE